MGPGVFAPSPDANPAIPVRVTFWAAVPGNSDFILEQGKFLIACWPGLADPEVPIPHPRKKYILALVVWRFLLLSYTFSNFSHVRVS